MASDYSTGPSMASGLSGAVTPAHPAVTNLGTKVLPVSSSWTIEDWAEQRNILTERSPCLDIFGYRGQRRQETAVLMLARAGGPLSELFC